MDLIASYLSLARNELENKKPPQLLIAIRRDG